jgi:hypothetical protein
MRISLLLVLVWVVCPVLAAPELSEADRERLADGTTDNSDDLDTQPGLYVLLRNAATWADDDFSGDAGAAVAPPPDYAFLKTKPEQARGNVYLIEGWLAYNDRWPTLVNHSSDKLYNTIDPSWGDQVTRWTIVTEKDNADATIIVLFNDPDGTMAAPEPGSKVRIAARFHKLWTIRDSNDKPFTYATFVGGAAETIEDAGSDAKTNASSPMSTLKTVSMAIFAVIALFFFIRIAMRKYAGKSGSGHQLGDRLEEMRRKRERMEESPEVEEDTEDLPEDPIAALEALRQKHEMNDQ